MTLKQFIRKNKLTFKEGTRNTCAVVLCGYAQFMNLEYADVCEAIPEGIRTGDLDIELERVWNYTYENNYANWWEIESNRKKYGV